MSAYGPVVLRVRGAECTIRRSAVLDVKTIAPGETALVQAAVWVGLDRFDDPDWRGFVAEAVAGGVAALGGQVGERPWVGEPEPENRNKRGRVRVPFSVLVTVPGSAA